MLREIGSLGEAEELDDSSVCGCSEGRVFDVEMHLGNSVERIARAEGALLGGGNFVNGADVLTKFMIQCLSSVED